MRRIKNRRGTTVVAVLTLAATALVPAMSASAQTSAKTVTIKVVGISRTGAQVAVLASVVPPHGNAIASAGSTYHLKPGPYFISGDVPTLSSDPNATVQTIVARRVDVRAGGTIKLDSRGGKPVSVWLNGKELSPDVGGSLQAEACVANGHGISAAYLNGRIYVKPTRTAGVNFIWAWSSGPAASTRYDLTGQTKNSLPAHPVFRVRTAQLVKTVIQVKAGTIPGTSGNLATSSELNTLCTMNGYQQPLTVPSSVTVYRSPALWSSQVSTRLGSHECGFDSVYTQEKAGRHYTVTISGAARGPYAAVPFANDNKLSYDPQFQFVAPAFQSFDNCFKSSVSLARGGHIVARRSGGIFSLFKAAVHPGRWYVLTTDAHQVLKSANLTRLLSPRTTLAWRFKLAKGFLGAVPVAVTSLVPQGLDMNNRAAPGSKTTVRASFSQGKYALPPKPDVPVRSFTVQASFNDGKTWHGVPVVKHKGFWTFVVPNPSSGFVTLRTVTVNVHGNGSTETIYRAYGIR
jgi:hypothetical protein